MAESEKKSVPVLEAENLSIVFGGLHAVDDVHFTLHENQIMGLIGPNGAGKTTVFNLLTGVYTPTTGQIKLDGRSILGKKTYQITKMGVARTFQNIRLYKDMSVLDNVRVAMNQKMNYSALAGILGLPSWRIRPLICCASSIWRVTRRTGRKIFPTASRESSRSRAPSRATRRCSFSTSPPPA